MFITSDTVHEKREKMEDISVGNWEGFYYERG